MKNLTNDFDSLTILNDVQIIIEKARESAVRSVDFGRVVMAWHIGERIINEEQQGQQRAEYGSYLIQCLAEKLEPQFGSGFSRRQLYLYRQFYLAFPIVNALRTQLNWTQYRLLLKIEDYDKREFYIAETAKNNWSSRQLERQINSQLYERLLLSNDKASVLAIAKSDISPDDPKQIIKDPMVLEFLGLQRESAYYEKDLEQAILTNLQEFLLELGNGFTFVARQKRLHIQGDEFFVDLVFYNRLLQCFVLIEIKTQKLTHQDIGQLQMYVNYYDRIEKMPYEKPTVGILLCADKNDAMVKFTLPENQQQIYASQYQLYLPSESVLLAELKKELQQFSEKDNTNTI